MSRNSDPSLTLALDHAYLCLSLDEHGLTLDEFEKNPWHHLRRLGLEDVAKQHCCCTTPRRAATH